MNTKHYTSIEQSKKLLELGLSPESADCMWEQHYSETPYITVKPHTTLGRSIGAHAIPCWSVGALLEVMPVGSTIEKCKDGYSCYAVYYSPFKGNNQIEAAYNMVVWLLENNYIKQ